MAYTLDDVIEATQALLHGHTGQDEQLTYLTTAITSTSTSLQLGSVEGLRRGIIEIEDELLWVDSVDTISKTVTIAPFGRGYRGTTAAAHVANLVPVKMNPLLPRYRVRQAINETINAVSGDLFGVSNNTIQFNSGQVAYELPLPEFGEILDIISLSWNTENTTEAWIPVRRWRYSVQSNLTYFPSGHSVEIFDPIRNGVDVNVVYTTSPQPFPIDADGSNPFSETTLPESCFDVVTYGAAARLAWAIEGGRNNQTGVSSNVLADGYGSNWRQSASAIAKEFYAFHQARLENERDLLLRNTQPVINFQR